MTSILRNQPRIPLQLQGRANSRPMVGRVSCKQKIGLRNGLSLLHRASHHPETIRVQSVRGQLLRERLSVVDLAVTRELMQIRVNAKRYRLARQHSPRSDGSVMTATPWIWTPSLHRRQIATRRSSRAQHRHRRGRRLFNLNGRARPRMVNGVLHTRTFQVLLPVLLPLVAAVYLHLWI